MFAYFVCCWLFAGQAQFSLAKLQLQLPAAAEICSDESGQKIAEVLAVKPNHLLKKGFGLAPQWNY